eukprot:4062089-Amphidinium_carterae.1
MIYVGTVFYNCNWKWKVSLYTWKLGAASFKERSGIPEPSRHKTTSGIVNPRTPKTPNGSKMGQN